MNDRLPPVKTLAVVRAMTTGCVGWLSGPAPRWTPRLHALSRGRLYFTEC